MNVFIDTSVIFTDPIWKRPYAKELINAAKKKKITIYISEVVYGELRYNYEVLIKKEIEALEKSYNKLGKFSEKKNRIKLPILENYIAEFESYYKSIFAFKNIVKVETKPYVFKKILNSAINHKAPFYNEKIQFKDSIIWTSYESVFIWEKLNNFHLLTSNTADFKGDELKKECPNLELYSSLEEFYKKNHEVFQTANTNFQKWIHRNKINEGFIFNLIINDSVIINLLRNVIIENEFNTIESAENGWLQDNEFKRKSYLIVKYDHSSIAIKKLISFEIDSFENNAIVNCRISVTCSGDGFSLNADRTISDRNKKYYTEYRIPVSFILDKDKIIKEPQVSSGLSGSTSSEALRINFY